MTDPDDYSDEDAQSLLDAWRRAQPAKIRATDGSTCEFDPEEDALTRQRWARVVKVFLDSPMGSGIEQTRVLTLLPTDQIGAWTEQIERWGGATVVTPEPTWDDETYDWAVDLSPSEDTTPIVITLERNTRIDPIEKMAMDDFAHCPVGAGYNAGDLAEAALGYCRYVFWATDTDDPAGFDMKVVFPLGYHRNAVHDPPDERVGGDLSAEDVQRMAQG